MNYISKCRLWLKAIEGVEIYVKRCIVTVNESNCYTEEEKEELLDCYNDIILSLEQVLRNDIE